MHSYMQSHVYGQTYTYYICCMCIHYFGCCIIYNVLYFSFIMHPCLISLHACWTNQYDTILIIHAPLLYNHVTTNTIIIYYICHACKVGVSFQFVIVYNHTNLWNYAHTQYLSYTHVFKYNQCSMMHTCPIFQFTALVPHSTKVCIQ